jgi:hypothetical protein
MQWTRPGSNGASPLISVLCVPWLREPKVTSVSASGDAVLETPEAARLAVALCLPQIVSTGILAILGAVPDSPYSVWAISLLSVTALPAFMVAAYGGPLLLIVAAFFVARAVSGPKRVQAAVASTALLLGIISFAFFELVVVWWDLPLP